MHRLIPRRWMGRGATALLCLTLLGGCATTHQQVRDTPTVETIRLNITKVRNAIEETRATIAVSRGAQYLPELYVRLAELLSEEARYHYQLAYEREQRSTKVLHVPQVRLLKEEAIATYEIVQGRFPDSPLVPQVLFNIGHEFRELGNFDDMRKAYQTLVDKYPDSPLRANALLVLGDYHFDRNELDDAKRFYEEIAKGPLQPVSGLGHYKLAWVWVNNGECAPALTNFEAAIEKSNAWEARMLALKAQAAETPLLVQQATAAGQGSASQDVDVRRESLVDMAYCYSRLRKPGDSVEFYKKMAYNRSTYVAALAKLANRYRTMDQFTGAMLTTRELLTLGSASIDRLDDARTLYTAIKRLKDYREVGTDSTLIASALVRYYSRVDIKPDERKRMIEEFEIYLRDLATTAQERANQNRKKSGDNAQVAKAYRVYMDTFRDAKERPNMLLNQADVLALADQNLEAGLASLEAADLLEDDNARRDALYDAVVHFQTSLEKASSRGRYERVAARSSLRRAGATLLAYKLTDDKERRVKFAIAQAVYDEGLYVEAIDKLTAVAYEFPQTTEADAAIRLALDSYNTINDYDGLMYASRRFMDSSSPATPTLKTDIKGVLAATEQRKLDELSLKAAGDEGGDIGVLIKFAEKNKGTELGERAVINAFVASRAVGDSENMYKLADSLAQNYPKSEQLPGIFTSLAQTAVARFDYDLAVKFLKRAADVNPAQRVQLLVAAGELNEQLGNVSKAESLFDEAIDGSTGQAKIDAVAKVAVLTERTSSGKDTLKSLKKYEDLGEPESLARIGLGKVAAGDVDGAEGNFQSVLNTDTASAESVARAHYGMAEVMLATIKRYPTPNDIDLIEEFIVLIEVTQQSYLNAARQGSVDYTPAALSRLATAMQFCADKLDSVPMPDGLTAGQKDQVKSALSSRVEGLRATAKEALEACGNLAWSNANFSPVVRECLKGRSHEKIFVPYDEIAGRKASPIQGLDELRAELSKNPEDVDKLRELGEKFINGGDPHSARLVLARAIQVGGGAMEQNLLGVASYEIGDYTGAFEAFHRAAEGGVEAGRANMKTLLQKVNVSKSLAEVDKRFQKGRDGGRLIK